MNGDDIEDLRERLRRAFPGHDPQPLEAALLRYGEKPYQNEARRVRDAIIALCDGDPQRLAEHLAIALQDYRDVLAAVSLPRPSADDVEAGRAAVRDLLERWRDD